MKHRELQIEAMHRMATAVYSRQTVDELVCEILRVAADVLHSQVGSIQIFEATTNTLVFRHVLDPKDKLLVGRSTSIFQGIAGQVFRSGRGEVTLQASENEAWNPEIDVLTGKKTVSMLTAALKGRGPAPLGIVQILNGLKEFDELDLEVLEVLCACAASAIETARLMEEARRAQLVHMVGDLAHDIKNMMTPIQTGTWVIQNIVRNGLEELQSANQENWREKIDSYVGGAETNLKDTMRAMRSAGDQIEARTLQLASLLRGEESQPAFVTLDLNQPLREVRHALGLVASSAGVRLEFELQEEMPLGKADPRMLYNAVYNLVINALAATPEGGRVTVRSQYPVGEENHFLIEVEDTGEGIPEDVQSMLFTERSITTKPGGTGLGTKIILNTARVHGGKIDFQTEQGCGTKFQFLLPSSDD